MAKIKLGNAPKNFKRVVKFPLLDGTEGSIEVTYKYRTRSEFGLFIDEILQAAGKDKTESSDEFSMLDLMEKTSESNADYVMQVIDGWSLDEDLTHENVQQLSDEIPAAVNAIMETYREVITKGRLGN